MRDHNRYQPPKMEQLKNEYDQRSGLYSQLVNEVKYILSNAIARKRIEISDIETRVKDFPSFYKKIVEKEVNTRYFDIVDDVAGVRILCLYRSDLAKIGQIIRVKFHLVRSELHRGTRVTPFGYMSDHYVVTLPSEYKGDRYDRIKRLMCEIQVRTISMHAWATMSHHLEYKQEIDIPSGLKSDFYALSGVFFIADSLFEQFRAARESSLRELNRIFRRSKVPASSEINLDILRLFLESRLADRERASDMDLSVLVRQLSQAKVRRLSELNSLLDANMTWLVKDEEKDPPISMTTNKKEKYTDAGVVRTILAHVGLLHYE